MSGIETVVHVPIHSIPAALRRYRDVITELLQVRVCKLVEQLITSSPHGEHKVPAGILQVTTLRKLEDLIRIPLLYLHPSYRS